MSASDADIISNVQNSKPAIAAEIAAMLREDLGQITPAMLAAGSAAAEAVSVGHDQQGRRIAKWCPESVYLSAIYVAMVTEKLREQRR